MDLANQDIINILMAAKLLKSESIQKATREGQMVKNE